MRKSLPSVLYRVCYKFLRFSKSLHSALKRGEPRLAASPGQVPIRSRWIAFPSGMVFCSPRAEGSKPSKRSLERTSLGTIRTPREYASVLEAGRQITY
jgi:hypothetical protein